MAAGRYIYTEELLALEAASGTKLSLNHLDHSNQFLPVEAWDPILRSHPDQTFAEFLRRGIKNGFRIGFDRSHKLKPCKENLLSTKLNSVQVDNHIADEVASGKLIEINNSPPKLHWNPMGIIPKPHQPGKYRLIVDLSAPQEFSVNDGISSELCSLHYASVADAAAIVKTLGQGALMAKLDLSQAYRRVPVHPEDQPLLGLFWRNTYYTDRALPFGLRSAPKIFTAVADGLAWAMIINGVPLLLHYLDDFFFAGPAGAPICKQSLETAVPLCASLGLPVAPHKVEGPSTTLIFLGIEIDSQKFELRLPVDKLHRLQSLIREWSSKKSASKHQLQSFIGHLSHAAAVVRPGRTFTRELIRTASIPKRSFHLVRLNTGCRADIAWWASFLPEWNGISLFPQMVQGPTLISDASGSFGCGAFVSGSLEWFQVAWPPGWQLINIAIKELIPITIGAALWGRQWSSSRITFLSDNQAVVRAVNSGSCRDTHLMHLLRILFFFEAHFGFEHVADHIPGNENKGADAISRHRAHEFLSLFPQEPQTPTKVPPELLEILFQPNLSWISPGWKALFQSTLRVV